MFIKAYYIHIIFPGVSLSECSGSQGGQETGLGSSDGKVGLHFQPSTGELLKRPGEMMLWTLSPPPCYVFFPPSSSSSGEAQQQELSQGLVKVFMHVRETHDTDDFIELK